MKRYIRCAQLYDFLDSDQIHEMMLTTARFGDFTSYRVLDNMMIETTRYIEYPGVGRYGAVSSDSRYWKLASTPDGWEAYEVSKDGVKIGEPFVVM